MEDTCYCFLRDDSMRIYDPGTDRLVSADSLEDYFLHISKEAPFNA
jgi:hypothetical protein